MLPKLCLPPCKKIENAAPIFFALSKDNHAQSGVPSQIRGQPGGQAQPACPMPDRGRGAAGPVAKVGVVRSFFRKKKSQRRHPAPRTARGRRCLSAKRRISSFIKAETFFIISKWGKMKNQKFFSIRSRPRLIDWRTDSSCNAPRPLAISLMLSKNDVGINPGGPGSPAKS